MMYGAQRIMAALLMLVPLFLATVTAQAAEKRIALLIGVSTYDHVASLKNPRADAELVRKSLRQAGFEADPPRFNLTRSELLAALDAFQAKQADVKLIYFAGHGVQLNGTNYLIPRDAKLATAQQVADQAITLSRALASVSNAKKLAMAVVDACRNNPFPIGRSLTRGLAVVSERQKPANLHLAFAAESGEIALDGSGGNSPYALALSKYMNLPMELDKVFRYVRDDVRSATKDEQRPIVVAGRGAADFYFKTPKGDVKLPAPPVVALREGEPCQGVLCQEIQRLDAQDKISEWIDFLAQYQSTPKQARQIEESISPAFQAWVGSKMAGREDDSYNHAQFFQELDCKAKTLPASALKLVDELLTIEAAGAITRDDALSILQRTEKDARLLKSAITNMNLKQWLGESRSGWRRHVENLGFVVFFESKNTPLYDALNRGEDLFDQVRSIVLEKSQLEPQKVGTADSIDLQRKTYLNLGTFGSLRRKLYAENEFRFGFGKCWFGGVITYDEYP